MRVFVCVRVFVRVCVFVCVCVAMVLTLWACTVYIGLASKRSKICGRSVHGKGERSEGKGVEGWGCQLAEVDE